MEKFHLPLLFFAWFCNVTTQGRPFLAAWRGGASTSSKKTAAPQNAEAYELLAKAVRKKLKSPDDGSYPDPSKLVKVFKSLASTQKAFKGLDGAAHEAYQRTHSVDDVKLTVSGRARRSADRAEATANGLGACELCELIEYPELLDLESPNGTLASRQVALNASSIVSLDGMDVDVLVLYEPTYEGGSGVHHSGIDDSKSPRSKGRLLIIVGEGSKGQQLQRTLKILDKSPAHVKLHSGLVSVEVASVQPVLYKAAGEVLSKIEAILRSHGESTALHFTGRSLAGGIAAIAATILEGGLPMPGDKKKKKGRTSSAHITDDEGPDEQENSSSAAKLTNTTIAPLSGLGKGRTSAVSLGSPPCLSANIQSDFVTSILYGDDIVCRASKESLDRFLERTRRSLKRQGVLGKRVNWMAETISLATSGIKSHAHGSEGEEMRLSVHGRAYLIRPRRLGGACSIHEVGSQLKGGREAMRAALLWQLNDILLSKSLWKHHQLDSYIHGLDRVHLRGVHEEEERAP